MKDTIIGRMLNSDKTIFFTFFPVTILLGSLVLFLPAAYGNPAEADLSYIDALFTAASAVCVTGLITVDTAAYTPFGQVVILALIQIGGLGIISLSTLFLAFPGKRISLKSRKVIKGYYIEMVEHEPKLIVRNIVLMTMGIEVVGAGFLYAFFLDRGVDNPFFTAVFHSVSAFCNAGFSVFSDSLERFREDAAVTTVVMLLIVTGGLSFIVIQELYAKARSRGKIQGGEIQWGEIQWGEIRREKISLHTKAVVSMTAVLILLGFGSFLLLEKGVSPLAALFQSVTPRTAGFNTVTQSGLTDSSKVVTMFLMLIGGAPGSIAGGIKVTTLFLLFFMIVKRPLEDGSIQVMRRNISGSLLSGAAQFLVKALVLLFFSVLALTITETHGVMAGTVAGTQGPSFMEILFEAVSAFGTVGLSLGLTPRLSGPGKIVIIWTMFAGRIGLITMAMPLGRKIVDTLIRYPDGEVMIG